MSCITRCALRWGLIGGLALGGATLLVGPERVAAGLAQIRTKAQHIVDDVVDDPIALRRQLEQLADEYPDRIAEVRGELAEVDHQVAQLDRDIEIASRVVAYTTDDLNVLKTRIAKAEAATGPAVYIRFEGVRFNVDEAYSEAIRINTVRETYRDRLAVDRQNMSFLNEQKARLTEILGKLETDYNTYQAQLWTLDRQIDAIERNERLIALTEQQQETLASYDRFGKVANLKQLQAKLAELRTQQEAQLEYLAKKGINHNYERQAVLEMDEATESSVLQDLFEGIETEIDDEVEAEEETSKSVALLVEPIIIE